MNLPQPTTGHDARNPVTRLHLAGWRLAKQLRQRLLPRAPEQYVFVAGMQRSGTNLLMDVLDASLSTDVYHETDSRAFDRYEMRPPEIIRALACRSPAPVFVVKALCEIDRLPALMAAFSPAKTLWVVRDWRDSVHSAIKSFGNFVPQWRRLAAGDAGDWRGRGMSPSTRALLANLYRDDVSEVEGAAIMWYYRNILFFEQALDVDPRVQVLAYEALVQLPQQEVARVFRFLDLPGFNTRIAARIHTRSVRHQEPVGVAPEIAARCDALLARFATLHESRA